VDVTPGGPEEPLSEIDALEEPSALDAPISFHLTEVAQRVAALETRLVEVQLLARRADDQLSLAQRSGLNNCYVELARAHLTKALETL